MIEQATGARVTDPDWDARLTGALTDFTFHGPQWAASLLGRTAAEEVTG
jgi:hypothetical protein